MKTPRGKNSTWLKVTKCLYSYYKESGLFFKLFLALLVAGPPALIGALYGNRELKKFLHFVFSDNFYQVISEIGRNNTLLFNSISFIWPIILLLLGSEIVKNAQSNGLSVDGLLALITSLDETVGTKSRRFNDKLRNINNLTKETAFESITDPRAQIEEIVRQICSFFNATQTDKKKALIRVTLAIMKNNKIESIPIWFPMDEAIKSSVSKLNSTNSAFLTAYRSKRILIISDVKKELQKPEGKRKFAETENEEDNSGSMICYPIKAYNSSVIPFVISIHCDEAGYFKDEFRELYEHSLKRFELRLSVEYSLLMMKESLCV